MRCAFCNNPSAELLANTLGIAYGQKVERERIIKLLDDKCERPLDPEWEHHWEDGCRCALVALIKGENK